MTQISAHMRQG